MSEAATCPTCGSKAWLLCDDPFHNRPGGRVEAQSPKEERFRCRRCGWTGPADGIDRLPDCPTCGVKYQIMRERVPTPAPSAEERCPTCGSEEPVKCRVGDHDKTGHTHRLHKDPPQENGGCCRDPFHDPKTAAAEARAEYHRGDTRREVVRLRKEVERLREALTLIAEHPTEQRNPDGDEQAAWSMRQIARDGLKL